jgi:hypothetical protein
LIRTPGGSSLAGVIFGFSKLKTTRRIGRKKSANKDDWLSSHHEIPVKVTAWIDEGVAPLVAALNEFEDVVTVDSCQEGPQKGAYVLFLRRGDHAVDLATNLAARLSPHDGEVDYLLRAEWRPGTGEPLLELACPTDQVLRVAQILSVSRRTA